ncbi:MAG: hypothetical protein HZB46_12815 [Solirubrobacterales bacterium]|nr:hypothetical protein [Solirubrobacterales bacterium]
MSLHRGMDGAEPLRPDPVGQHHEEERRARSGHLASGTLACPSCDAPVALDSPASPAHPLACPFCAREGALREFLSLGEPTRPAHVVVRVVLPRYARRPRSSTRL